MKSTKIQKEPINISIKFPQFFLRLALGIGFIIPFLDRLGFLGAAGDKNISWGNWESFIHYTGTLMPFLAKPMINIIGGIASVLELVFGIALIFGFKTRLAALGSFALTLIFALSMTLFLGYKAPLNYSVFAVSAASLLLAAIPVYEWSIDNYVSKSFTNK
jgi:putative oxidoreductase